MKKISLTLLISAFIAQPSEADLVPNGEFQMYKPGTDYTVTATFGVGNNSFAKGVGDGIELSGGTVSYSDGSADGMTGDGIPDIDMPGWAPLQSGNDLFGNGVDGSNGMNLFAAWGGDGRIQSAAPLGIIESGNIYTISVLVGGPDAGPIQGPLAFHLAADGVQLTPSAVVDPTLPNGGAFQEISRTYNADSIAGHIGAEMTIELGVEDANDFANRVVFENVSMEVVNTGPPPTFSLLITSSGSDLKFVWDSQAGMYYVLRTSTDLEAELSTWTSVNVPGSVEVEGVFQIAHTAPVNTHGITRPVADPNRFYRVQEFPRPPVTVFFDDFDGDAQSWTTDFDPSDTGELTAWEVGDPFGGAEFGPPDAFSGANCYGTNILADYGVGSNTWLRTPAIDLTSATGATVTFQEWVDIDGGAGDHGVLRVLDASGLPGTVTELAVVLANVVGLSDDVDEWVEYSADLPEDALRHSVVLEFSLVSDAVEDNLAAGWYLDDVTVTTPAP